MLDISRNARDRRPKASRAAFRLLRFDRDDCLAGGRLLEPYRLQMTICLTKLAISEPFSAVRKGFRPVFVRGGRAILIAGR